MAIVMTNGDLTGVVHPVKTWGELLELLDQEQARQGEVVTAVRLNGVDEPAFRSPELAGTVVPADLEVAIDTAQPATLVLEALDEADAVARNIAAAAQELALAYRRQHVTQANQALRGFADCLGSLVVATSAVAQGANVDLRIVGDGHQSAVSLIQQLIASADTLAGAQRNRAWTRMADVLEHEIAAIVSRWPLVLREIRLASPVAVRAAA